MDKKREQEIAIILKFQKKQGLNKVTVKKVGDDKYQALMNGKKVFKPATPATTLKHLKMLKLDAEQHDKTGVKLNQ